MWAMALAAVTDPWVPADTFGARLAQIRQHLGGWNVKRTAELCGIDDQTWRNWERGPSKPRDFEAICKQIADATGCNLDWLMRGGPVIRWSSDGAPLTCVNDVLGQMELAFVPERSLVLAST